MRRYYRAICLVLVLAMLNLPALAATAKCTHPDADWVVTGTRYEYVDAVQHRVVPVVAKKLHCPDCGRDVDVDDLDADDIYDRAGPMVEDIRTMLLELSQRDLSILSSDEQDLVILMRAMVNSYDQGSKAFAKWAESEGRKVVGQTRLETHSYISGVCACGAKQADNAYIVSGSQKIKMNKGDILQIALKNASPKGWKAKSSKIVKLSRDGRIKALKEGKTTVTITLKSGKKWKLTVTVVDPNKPQGIQINEKGPLTLRVGQSQRLTPILSPSSATTKLKWSSSRSKVVSVSSNGTLKAKRAGSATITVKTANGKKATIKIKVKK